MSDRWPDAMTVTDGIVQADYTPPEEEPALYADGQWPCQIRLGCGCAGLIDCPGPV